MQRGHCRSLNSSNLHRLTRNRVARRWSLVVATLEFAVPHSLKCYILTSQIIVPRRQPAACPATVPAPLP
jgi:hypothetical protein